MSTTVSLPANVSPADPMLPRPYEVARVRRETRDTFTLALEPVADDRVPFAAGQFNMLYVFGAGEIPISISGDPARDSVLLHTVRAVGTVTEALGRVKRGDVVGVRGPFGRGWPIEEAGGFDIVIAAGGIGLVTNGASAEYRDLRVTHDGQTIFDGSTIADPAEMTLFRGNWQTRDGVIRQANERDAARAQFGDPTWQDYTLSLKARKLAGRQGFGVIVRHSDGGSYLQWNLGSDDNKQHTLEAHLASHSVDDTTVDRTDGSLESNRWYDLKVELNGARVRCFVDGKLVHDVEIPPLNLPRLFAVASRDDDTGALILKLVNPTDEPTEVEFDLAGLDKVGPSATALVLSGDPEDENSLEHPQKIEPREESLPIDGTHFEHTLAPNSLTILRLDAS